MANTFLLLISIVVLSIGFAEANYYSWRRTTPPIRQPSAKPTNPPSRPDKVYTLGILLYPDVEVLDVNGPFEVFAVAGEMHQRFRVLMISDKKTVRAKNGLNIIADHLISDRNTPKLDIIVLPGTNTSSTNAALNNPVYLNWIKRVEPGLDYVVSVCTGVNFLCRAGLVNGLDITTHHQAFDLAGENCPNSKLLRNRRFTDNGRILTSAGISAGIDLSLYVVKKLTGRNRANEVADRMEYEWWQDYDYDPVRGPIPNVYKVQSTPRL